MAIFDNVLADLSRLSIQLDCKHLFIDGVDYKACLKCKMTMAVCRDCQFPTYDSECAWCDK
jgi:hypothetical protein